MSFRLSIAFSSNWPLLEKILTLKDNMVRKKKKQNAKNNKNTKRVNLLRPSLSKIFNNPRAIRKKMIKGLLTIATIALFVLCLFPQKETFIVCGLLSGISFTMSLVIYLVMIPEISQFDKQMSLTNKDYITQWTLSPNEWSAFAEDEALRCKSDLDGYKYAFFIMLAIGLLLFIKDGNIASLLIYVGIISLTILVLRWFESFQYKRWYRVAKETDHYTLTVYIFKRALILANQYIVLTDIATKKDTMFLDSQSKPMFISIELTMRTPRRRVWVVRIPIPQQRENDAKKVIRSLRK